MNETKNARESMSVQRCTVKELVSATNRSFSSPVRPPTHYYLDRKAYEKTDEK